jgi:hypothetical protein
MFIVIIFLGGWEVPLLNTSTFFFLK